MIFEIENTTCNISGTGFGNGSGNGDGNNLN